MAQTADRTGFAISGGIGLSLIEDVDGDETFNDNAFGYILGFEYRFIPQFALGFNVFSLGTGEDFFDGADTELEVKGIDLTGRIILPVTERTEFYGVIGGANYSADLRPGGSTGLFGEDAWVFGLGLDIDTTADFSIRIEGRYFSGPRDETGGLLTAGFSYRF